MRRSEILTSTAYHKKQIFPLFFRISDRDFLNIGQVDSGGFKSVTFFQFGVLLNLARF